MKSIAIVGFDARMRNGECRYRPFDKASEYVDEEERSEGDLKRFYVMHSSVPADFDLLITEANAFGSTCELRRTSDMSGAWYVLRPVVAPAPASAASQPASKPAAQPASKRSLFWGLLSRKQSV